jgi:hypothetical protein
MNNFFTNFVNFYTTKRQSFSMSDNGGPFGFDIHFALEIDYLIKSYNVDCFFETGTNSGDTTEYLCKTYPHLNIVSCETNLDYFKFAKKRLQNYKNVYLFNESSEAVIAKLNQKFQMTLYYLDAHWNDYWPLKDEIKNIDKGLICVSDFYNPYQELTNLDVEYGYDTYQNISCDVNLLNGVIQDKTKIYTNNVLDLDVYEYPCLQRQRRTGRAYFNKNINLDLFSKKNYFLPLT